MTNPDHAVYPLVEVPLTIGLTKRELFAAMAMQGMLSSPEVRYKNISIDSVEIADALIKELNK